MHRSSSSLHYAGKIMHKNTEMMHKSAHMAHSALPGSEVIARHNNVLSVA